MTEVELITEVSFASVLDVIGKVVDLGRSYLGDNYGLHTGTREMLENLEIQLLRIQSMIEAAGNWQITSSVLETWLEQVNDAAYKAKDVLEADFIEFKRIRESLIGKGLKELKSVVKKLDELCIGDFIRALQAHSDKGKEHLGNLGSETSSHLAPGIFGRDKETEFISDTITEGWLASSVINKVLRLGRSYLSYTTLPLSYNYGMHKASRMLGDLEIHLCRIQSMIKEAEKRQITSRGLATWLEQVKDAAYEVEDVLEDFDAKRIGASVKGKGKFSEIASSSLIASSFLFLISSLSVKMVSNVRIHYYNDWTRLTSALGKLDKLCCGDFIQNLLLSHTETRIEHLDKFCSETSSNLDPDVAIFGRDREIRLILAMILNVSCGGLVHQALDDPNLQQGNGEGSSSYVEWILQTFKKWSIRGDTMSIQTVKKGDVPEQSKNIVSTVTTIAEPYSISNRELAVLPIVGIGGIGKTVVAKSIYKRVKENFSLEAWVYVSENDDAKKIMQALLCSFEGSIRSCTENSNIVEKRLVETITNNRFLLILDNVSDRTEHISLQAVLSNGGVGSVAVVTTQSRSIAETMGTLPVATLDVLQQKSFWKLFKYYAFDGFKFRDLNDQLLWSEQEKLKLIGKQIAEKLHGLPLAGKVIGKILSTRLEKEFWEKILESDWWNIKVAREDILPSVGAGYNSLQENYLFPALTSAAK